MLTVQSTLTNNISLYFKQLRIFTLRRKKKNTTQFFLLKSIKKILNKHETEKEETRIN